MLRNKMMPVLVKESHREELFVSIEVSRENRSLKGSEREQEGGVLWLVRKQMNILELIRQLCSLSTLNHSL